MRALAATLALCLLASVAVADEAQPWADGVSQQKKDSAKALLDAGNALFLEKKHADALAKYREAIGHWDHPAIRFNIVRCLIQLERYVEADENLKLALKYGAAPLEDAVFQEAGNYEKLLAKQVVELSVACDQPGVKLTLDGQPIGDCPTKVARRVAPGRHQIVGVKSGFLTKTEDLTVVGGEAKSIDVKLVPIERAAKIEHRWPTWMPWVVFGSGLAVAGIGGIVQLKANGDMRAYDREIQNQCGNGCAPGMVPPEAQDNYDLAQLENKLGIATISIGAAVAVTGGVLLYLNRGRTVYPQERATQVGVVPTSGGGMLTLGGGF